MQKIRDVYNKPNNKNANYTKSKYRVLLPACSWYGFFSGRSVSPYLDEV